MCFIINHEIKNNTAVPKLVISGELALTLLLSKGGGLQIDGQSGNDPHALVSSG